MTKIKATELLIKVYEDVKKIKEIVTLQSFQYNLILKKINELNQKKEIKNEIKNEKRNTRFIKENSPFIKATESLPVGSLDSVEKMPELGKEEFNFEEVVDEVPVEKKGLAQKVPITQLVYTENNKPVAIGSVEIKDDKGDVVIKTKTNSVGRWSALVFPGEYVIHFTRRYGKYIVEFDQEINVGSENHQTEILPPEPYRKKQNG